MDLFKNNYIDFIIENCIEEFSNRIFDIINKTDTDINDIYIFIEDFVNFINKKILKIDPDFSFNIIIYNYIFSKFLIAINDNENNFDLFLIKFENEVIRKAIEIEKDSEKKEYYIEIYIKKTSLEEIEQIIKSEMIYQQKNELSETNIISFLNIIADKIKNRLIHLFNISSKPNNQKFLVDTLIRFEEKIIDDQNTKIAEKLHNLLWMNTNIPDNLTLLVSLHKKRINGIIIQNKILQNIMQTEFNTFMNLYKVYNLDEINIIISAISKEVENSKYFKGSENIITLIIASKVFKLLFKKHNINNYIEILYEKINVNLEETINSFYISLVAATKRQVDSLKVIPFNENTRTLIEEFSINTSNYLKDELRKKYFWLEIDSDLFKFMICMIYRNFLKSFYQDISIEKLNYILLIVAVNLNCHESNILPFNEINSLEIANFIIYKAHELLQNILDKVIENRFKELQIVFSNDLENLNDQMKQHFNFMKQNANDYIDGLKELRLLVKVELENWELTDESQKILFFYIIKKCFDELNNGEQKGLINIFNKIIGKNIMNEVPDLYNALSNQLSILKKVYIENVSIFEDSDFSMIANDLEVQKIVLNDINLVISNFISILIQIKKDHVSYHLPMMPDLIEANFPIKLSHTEYLILMMILDYNMRGELFICNYKEIQLKFSISEKTSYNAINNLIDNKFIVLIHKDTPQKDELSKYIINAPRILNLLLEYNKNKIINF